MYLIGRRETEAVTRVIQSGKLFRYLGDQKSQGDLFEQEWSSKIGTDYTVAVTSGTAALICGLVGLGIGPGDEVIVPGYTFMASAMAPLAVGAVPVIAEVDESMTLDPADLDRKITSRTRAIIPVHMDGLPCDMAAIMTVARDHGLHVLEDVAQATGGSHSGRRLGSIGEAGAFSFNYWKIITCGEGGALTTSNRTVYERALLQHDSACIFRDYASGITTPFFSGWNFRLSEVLSAILRVQLGRLDGILEALRAEKRLLVEELHDAAAFRLNRVNDPEGDCATKLMLLFDSAHEARAFSDRMRAEGIDVYYVINSGRHLYSNWEPIMERRGAHHPALDPLRSPDLAVQYTKDMCPRTLDLARRTVGILTDPARTPEETRDLARTIRQAAEKPT
jgi:dTDP-4-amino-4,6-dideoxygalactose transaminase